MTTNREEPQQEPDADLPVAPDDGNASGETVNDGDDSGMVQIPAEFVANLPPELLESLPPEIQAAIQRGAGESHMVMRHFSTSMSMMLGNIVNPIASQINPQHITDIIGITGRELDHEYGDRKHSRLVWAFSIAFAIAVLLALSIVLTLSGMGELLLDIFKGVAIFAGGFGGGYGFSALRRR